MTPWEQKVRKWINAHHGILSIIAVECTVSPQYVQQVAYGKSTSLAGNDVELALVRHGWPGPKR
jgi:hypothetical protein